MTLMQGPEDAPLLQVMQQRVSALNTKIAAMEPAPKEKPAHAQAQALQWKINKKTKQVNALKEKAVALRRQLRGVERQYVTTNTQLEDLRRRPLQSNSGEPRCPDGGSRYSPGVPGGGGVASAQNQASEEKGKPMQLQFFHRAPHPPASLADSQGSELL